MISNLIFTYCSILFVVILLIPYFTKKQKQVLSVKLFKWILILSIFIIITEIFVFLLFKKVDNDFIIDLITKIHWTFGYLYFFILYFYIYSTSIKNRYNSIIEIVKSDKISLIFFILSIIFYIISLFIKIPKMTEETFNFIPGVYGYFVTIYFILTIILVFISTRKNYYEGSRINRSLFFGTFAIISISLFQYCFPNVAAYGLGISWALYIIYFNLENPDLKLLEETDNLKNQAEKSFKSKNDFLSNISQEIVSPMNSIIGFSNAIVTKNSYDEKKVLDDIKSIKASSNNLLNIVNNILDISKIESGTNTIENVDYSFKDLIIAWNDFAITTLVDKDVTFSLDVDSNISSIFNGDKNKIYQIISNLLASSIKNTNIGKIVLKITSEKINNELEKLKFIVIDTGQGIGKNNQNKGLGLALVNEYSSLLGGKFSFESEYRIGTTFNFELSQKIVNNTPIGNIDSIISNDNKKEYSDYSNKKILIIDDDELSLIVTEKLLSPYKCLVVGISDPEECIFRIKNGEEYDIIFMDHMLKNIDGLELCKSLKALQGYKIPPIVMLTANAIGGLRDYYLKYGFSEYISKPIDINELDRILKMFFKE